MPGDPKVATRWPDGAANRSLAPQQAHPLPMPPDSTAPNTKAGARQRAMRTEPHPNCQLCGGAGAVLYQALEDRIFDVPGSWGLRRCSNPTCRHVWLDPQPIGVDLHLLYEEYYTHGAVVEETRPRTALKPLRRLSRFGYEAFVRLSGLAREREAAFEMYLGNRPPGRLLEIGCGSGERLARFAAKGWSVQGQDVDAKAVAHARAATGLPVHLGPIESLPGSAGPFDAVVMNHVIEHVPDPEALLRQAGALIAAGGVLVAVTPNIESLGHRWFDADWRGLEPPRHLHLFYPRTLAGVARRAGLNDIRVTTSAASAEGIAVRSSELARKGRCGIHELPDFLARIAGALFQIAALARHRFDRESGEECIMIGLAGSGGRALDSDRDGQRDCGKNGDR